MKKLLRRIKYFFLFLKSLKKVSWSLKKGMWQLSELRQPAITVFGGTNLSTDSPHSVCISSLTKKLSTRGFSIITGGGPGIMEAANLGAFESAHHMDEDEAKQIMSLGIGVQGLEGKNKYVQRFIALPYFFTRKWLLVRYSVGFIVGPGGFGTMDELAEVLTLIQTKQMPKVPIVLIGKEYWEPFYDWIHQRALRDKLLSGEDAALLTITDDTDEAFRILMSHCSENSQCAIDFTPSKQPTKLL